MAINDSFLPTSSSVPMFPEPPGVLTPTWASMSSEWEWRGHAWAREDSQTWSGEGWDVRLGSVRLCEQPGALLSEPTTLEVLVDNDLAGISNVRQAQLLAQAVNAAALLMLGETI